ncbi:MAG TPA: hypothetical protein V6D20_08425, partial [Candidatus Obscuribacterales bacterium]
NRRSLIIVAVSLALGLGVVYSPEILADKHPLIKNVFSSGISTGGLTAILLNWLLPQNMDQGSLPPMDEGITDEETV